MELQQVLFAHLNPFYNPRYLETTTKTEQIFFYYFYIISFRILFAPNVCFIPADIPEIPLSWILRTHSS